MVDDPMNILALKRFAVEHSDLNDHKPHVVDNTGKRVAVIGGGPAGLSCAYYLAVMGHKVTIFEQRHHLGGMLRYGIPSYRLPRERLQAEIDWILSAGIDAELDHSVNGEELVRLRDEFDASTWPSVPTMTRSSAFRAKRRPAWSRPSRCCAPSVTTSCPT